jgi:predicted RNA-binding Zn-ribbon protein involved in translation (DUF1610 family)
VINQIVRDNLINVKGYSPYCGNHKCYEMPRTHFDGSQFYCNNCGWVSSFPVDFIKKYTDKWGI